MARKPQFYTVEEDNRDKGKTFVITVMSAWDTEEWATRVLLALMSTDTELPDAKAGIAQLAAVGFKALSKLPFEQVKIFTDQLLSCVKFMPDKSKPNATVPIYPEHFEEVSTIMKLKMEVFQAHVNFYTGETPST